MSKKNKPKNVEPEASVEIPIDTTPAEMERMLAIEWATERALKRDGHVAKHRPGPDKMPKFREPHEKDPNTVGNFRAELEKRWSEHRKLIANQDVICPGEQDDLTPIAQAAFEVLLAERMRAFKSDNENAGEQKRGVFRAFQVMSLLSDPAAIEAQVPAIRRKLAANLGIGSKPSGRGVTNN
jgi:hypothetical protein